MFFKMVFANVARSRLVLFYMKHNIIHPSNLVCCSEERPMNEKITGSETGSKLCRVDDLGCQVPTDCSRRTEWLGVSMFQGPADSFPALQEGWSQLGPQ